MVSPASVSKGWGQYVYVPVIETKGLDFGLRENDALSRAR